MEGGGEEGVAGETLRAEKLGEGICSAAKWGDEVKILLVRNWIEDL